MTIGQSNMEIGSTNTAERTVDVVVEHLMTLVVEETWAPGSRIATERELAAELEVSRATVRVAIDRLAEWGVLVARQGSGTVVQPRSRWRLSTLPYLLAVAVEAGDRETLATVLTDALAARNMLVEDLLRRAAAHRGGVSFDAARQAAFQAWEARRDPALFLKRDHAFLLSVAEAARLPATMFILNELRLTYESVILRLAAQAEVPECYVRQHLATADALEQGDAAAAVANFRTYVNDLNASLVATIPWLPSALAKERE